MGFREFNELDASGRAQASNQATQQVAQFNRANNLQPGWLTQQEIAAVTRVAFNNSQNDAGFNRNIQQALRIVQANHRAMERTEAALLNLGVRLDQIYQLENAWDRQGLSTRDRLEHLVEFLQTTRSINIGGGPITQFEQYRPHMTFMNNLLMQNARYQNRQAAGPNQPLSIALQNTAQEVRRIREGLDRELTAILHQPRPRG